MIDLLDFPAICHLSPGENTYVVRYLRLGEEVRGDWTLVKPHTSSRTHLGGLKTVDREKVCPELSLDENNKAVM